MSRPPSMRSRRAGATTSWRAVCWVCSRRGQLAQVDGAGGELVLGDGGHDVLLGGGRHRGVGAPGGSAGCGGAWLARAVDGVRAGPRARSIGVRPPAPARLPGGVEGAVSPDRRG